MRVTQESTSVGARPGDHEGVERTTPPSRRTRPLIPWLISLVGLLLMSYNMSYALELSAAHAVVVGLGMALSALGVGVRQPSGRKVKLSASDPLMSEDNRFYQRSSDHTPELAKVSPAAIWSRETDRLFTFRRLVAYLSAPQVVLASRE